MNRRRVAAVAAVLLLAAIVAMLLLARRAEQVSAHGPARKDGTPELAESASSSGEPSGEDGGAAGAAPVGDTAQSPEAADDAYSPGTSAETVAASPEEWVSGVVSGPDGRPIESAKVDLSAARMQLPTGVGGAGRATFMEMAPAGTGTTDTDGRYLIALDVAPPISVRATADGMAANATTLYPALLKRELDPWGRRIVRVDFKLAPGTLFSGRVVDESGEPVSGASVEAIQHGEGSWGRTERLSLASPTDVAGRFAIEGLRAAPCKLRLAHGGFASVDHDVKDIAEERDWTLSRSGGAIAGRVVLQATGEPVVGASLQAWRGMPDNMSNDSPLGVSATSGSDGRFRIEPLAAGIWDVVASSGSMKSVDPDSPLGRRIVLGEEQVIDDVVFTLGAGWRIEGVVVDALSGAHVAGATVMEGYSRELATAAAPTDADGRFVLEGVFGTKLFSGTLEATLFAEKPGWATKEPAKIALSFGDAGPGPVRIEMVPRQPVRGVVKNADGSPAPRVPVSLYDRTRGGNVAFSDEQGRFELSAPANARAQVEARIGELKSFSEAFDVVNEPLDGIEVVLDPGGTLVVRCEDESGALVGNATVWMMVRTQGLEGWGSSMRDGTRILSAPGEATFEALPTTAGVLPMDLRSRSLDVGIHSETWRSAEKDGIELKPGETETVTLTLLPKDATHFIDGVVVDWEDNPVEGASVQAWGDAGNGRTTTDALGAFRLEKLSPGSYNLQVSHPGRGHASQEADADSTDVRIVMKHPDTRWTAQVLDEDTGKRIENCQTDLQPLEGQKAEAFAHFDTFDFVVIVGGLMPGVPRKVRLSSEGYEPLDVEVLIPSGSKRVETVVRMRRRQGS